MSANRGEWMMSSGVRFEETEDNGFLRKRIVSITFYLESWGRRKAEPPGDGDHLEL